MTLLDKLRNAARGLRRAAAMALYLAAVAPALAQESTPKSAREPGEWRAWLESVWPEAEARGVSRATFDGATAGLAPDCEQPGVSCGGEGGAGDRFAEMRARGLPVSCFRVAQKEFLKPSGYFPPNYMSRLALKGQDILKRWREERPEVLRHVLEIERRTGIGHRMLLAVWARETAYGEAPLNYNAVRALSSMAYAGPPAQRRWARRQFVAALVMIEKGYARLEDLKSSYAGATGLTQLMPDEFLARAVDGDADGRRDVWNSEPDALATTAQVLLEKGWNPKQRGWGYEVTLPEPSAKFDCTMEGKRHRRSIAQWAGEFGVARAGGPASGGRAFPDPSQEGYLVLPAGARGPAFIVTDNFDALRRYNPADLYALFIGNVADRIGCETPERMCLFARPWPSPAEDDFPFSVENLCRMQIALKERGFTKAAPDGLFGPETRAAIGRYQKSLNRKPDCYPSLRLFEELAAAGADDPGGGAPVPAEASASPR